MNFLTVYFRRAGWRTLLMGGVTAGTAPPRCARRLTGRWRRSTTSWPSLSPRPIFPMRTAAVVGAARVSRAPRSTAPAPANHRECAYSLHCCPGPYSVHDWKYRKRTGLLSRAGDCNFLLKGVYYHSLFNDLNPSGPLINRLKCVQIIFRSRRYIRLQSCLHGVACAVHHGAKQMFLVNQHFILQIFSFMIDVFTNECLLIVPLKATRVERRFRF